MERYVIRWPWSVDYEKVNRVDTDVLVVGGGIAGSWAAISAAKRGGVNVAVVDVTDVFAAGPAGCDHWVYALDNPCCKVSPEEFIEATELAYGGYINGVVHYVTYREGYDALLELEGMGAKVRDTEDEFKGAPFRDEETKLLFAYDYDNKHTIRVWGQTFRTALYAELLRRRVKIFNRIFVTSLLTAKGEQGTRVVGATGVDVRTGEFYIFKAKAVVLCTGGVHDRIWLYAGHRFLPTVRPPHLVGSGLVLAWKAGVELTLMEGRISGPRRVSTGFPSYGTGRYYATWYPSTMVDAKGREIPYVDKDGRFLTSFEQRVRPSLLNQRFFLERIYHPAANQYRLPTSLDNTPAFIELVKKGEYTLPLYADLPSMPEHERRAIFGLMIPQEGKTWIVYRNLTQWGFDPDKDMLQCYEIAGQPLDTTLRGYIPYFGGVVHDWCFKTNVEGLYAAGDVLFSTHYHSTAVTSGRWAGAKAADYAKKASEPRVDEEQVEAERRRVYASTRRAEGIEWKELNTGICKVMRVYCGEYITEEMLNVGLRWLNELKAKEAQMLVARNPHELWRNLEALDLLSLAEIIMLAMRERKSSSQTLNFYRLDYPQIDPPEWNKFITIKQEDGKLTVGEMPLRWWLKPPYAPTYQENYEKYKPW